LVLAVVAAILANVALFLAVYARSFNAQLESLGGEAILQLFQTDAPELSVPDGGDEPVWRP
ncbi:MAG: hypothetical protein K8E66_02550, partial [Phycisphaerales bacterium]|nr:hypothetical protein [Phycisphaerales bacterium]